MGILRIFRLYPTRVWLWTLVAFIYVLRKTIFNVAREVGSTAATIDQGTSMLLLALGATAFVLFSNQKDFSRVRKKTVCFSNYYFFCIISILWAGSFVSVFFKATEVLMSFFIEAFIIYKIDTLRNAILYTILTATAVTYCDFGDHFLKVGFQVYHTNGYSVSAMVAILLSLGCMKYGIFKLKDLWWILLFNGTALVLGTSSASFMSAGVGLLCLYGSGKKGKNLMGIFLLALVAYLFYVVFSEQIESLVFYGKTEEEIESGTGRAIIWDAAFKAIADKPLLGGGFFMGERNLYKYGSFMVLSAHNGFLSVLVNTGIVGMLLFLNFFYRWFKVLYRRLGRNIYAPIVFPAFVAVTVNTMAFPGIGADWNYVSPVIFCLIGLSFLKVPYCNV